MSMNDSESSTKGQFDRDNSSEVLHRQFGESRVAHGVNPVDGLPSPVGEGGDLEGPPMTHDLFVCIADEREFVLRDVCGDILVSLTPSEVYFSPNGKYWATMQTLLDRVDGDTQKLNQIGRSAHDMPRGGLSSERRPETKVEVQALRPRCRYLVEMVNGFERSADHVTITRLCQMRHDAAGDLLSLGDEMVVACTARSPADFVSIDRLRKLNAATLAAGEKRVAAGGIFDVNTIGAKDDLEGVLE